MKYCAQIAGLQKRFGTSSLSRWELVAWLGVALITTAHAATDATIAQTDAEALAELTRPQSKIEIGAGTMSDASFAVGNASGLDRRGAFFIGNFDLRGSQYSYGNTEDDKTRWRIVGTHLGLSSRSLAGEYGRQGIYRITFGYDEIPRRYSDSYQTPFLGAGTSNLTLPAGFVRTADTTTMAALDASLRRFDVASNRKRAEIGVSYAISREWEFKAGVRNDDREGTRIRGAEFGSSPANPRAMLLPEPINSATQLIDASLSFNDEDLRATIAYHGSIFKNNIVSLVWQNPYSSAPWVGAGTPLPASFPLPLGQLGEAPDNQFHQLSLNAAYDFSSTTRLNVTATRGRMTQNEMFLPYTINPGLGFTAPPKVSLDGVVETTFLNARLAMRPARNLNVRATLRYEDRNNQTPQSEYLYIGGDVQLQPPPGASTDRSRTNLPRSRRQTQMTLDADYRFPSGMTVKVGWDHDDVARTYAEVERAVENAYRIEWRPAGTGSWTTSASLAHLVRRASNYLYNAPFLSSYTSPAFIAGLAAANGCTVPIDCIRAGPLQRKFYMADRDRARARFSVGFTPDAALSLQARLDVNHDRYPRTTYGVTDSRNWSANAEAGYVWSEMMSASLFFTVEDQRQRERGRVVLNPALAGNADADWWNQMADQTVSAGFGARHHGLAGGKLELGADIIIVRGRTPISTRVGPAVPPAQNPATALPDLTARSDNLNLTARYAMDRRSTVRIQYFFRHLDNADWALQQVAAATLANVIGTREIPVRATVHGIGVSYIRSFR